MEFYVDKCLETLKEKYAEYFWRLPFNVHYIIFDQTWGSTALGFYGKAGGSAITKAPTLVVYNHKIKDNSKVADVFFGSSYAYSCKMNDNFNIDLTNHKLKDTNKAKELYESFQDDDIVLMEEIYFEEKQKNFKEEQEKKKAENK